MRSWRLAAGFINGQYATPAPAGPAYYNDFETNTDGLTGSWARTNKWAKSGSYSVGSTNQGVNSSDNIATLSLSLSKAARVTFNGYTQGETGQDGFWVDVNGTAWDGTEITYPNGSSGSQVNDNGGHKLLSSASGIEFAYSKIVTPGSLAFRFGFRKDGSVDVGLDGGFVDNLKVEYLDIPMPANPSYFDDFETGTGAWTGDWAPSSEWSITGTKSLGRTNKGVQSSTTTASLARTLTEPSVVEFYFFTQGEASVDGMTININGSTPKQSTDVSVIAGAYSSFGPPIVSATGVWGKYSKEFPAGPLNVNISYVKDQSVDVGLDGAFIDHFAIYPTPPSYRRSVGLHFDGANGSTTFTDRSGKVWTPDTGVVISTEQSVFGGASLKTRTLNKQNCIATPYSPDMQLTGDFTVRAKLYPLQFNTIGTALVFFAQDALTKRSYSFRLTTNAGLITGIQAVLFTAPTVYADTTASLSMDYGKWYDVEFCRKDGTMYIFLDGRLVQSGANPTVPYSDGTVGATIGGDRYTDGPECFNGYIDEFEMYQRALHTASFTPSPNPFVD